MITEFHDDYYQISIIKVTVNMINPSPVVSNIKIEPKDNGYVRLFLGGDFEVTLRINYNFGYNRNLCERALTEIFKNFPNIQFIAHPKEYFISEIAKALEYRNWYLR